MSYSRSQGIQSRNSLNHIQGVFRQKAGLSACLYCNCLWAHNMWNKSGRIIAQSVCECITSFFGQRYHWLDILWSEWVSIHCCFLGLHWIWEFPQAPALLTFFVHNSLFKLECFISISMHVLIKAYIDWCMKASKAMGYIWNEKNEPVSSWEALIIRPLLLISLLSGLHL